jgi:hypothetical protein
VKAIAFLGLLCVACYKAAPVIGVRHPASSPRSAAALIVEGARDELTWGTSYDPAYCRIAYPSGDVPRSKGVCTDVVIRALRHAGFDLQKLIHEDMRRDWAAYPRYPGRDSPDPNIDHRRVPNQRVFFFRHGRSIDTGSQDVRSWQPGDIVEWRLPSGRDHTGIVTDRLNAARLPYVIHNIGYGPQEEDVLRAPGWTITGHFRYPG